MLHSLKYLSLLSCSVFSICSCPMLNSEHPGETQKKHHKHKHKHEQTNCNQHEKHPEYIEGSYYRSNVVSLEIASARPLLTLNDNGTAIMYNGLALYRYLTGGTGSPAHGSWKYIGNDRILVMVLDFEASESIFTSLTTFVADRITLLIDFSESRDSPQIIARSVVQFTAEASETYLDPEAGLLLVNEITSPLIEPFQLKRISAFGSDLFRNP